MRFTSLLLCALASPLAAQAKIPVLLVSGANNHDWEWTTPSLATILTESGRFDVKVTYDPARDLAKPLDAYEAIVLDYNGPRWGEAAEKNFLAAVSSGVGVSVIHAADNAFPGWEEYETLVALLWRRKGEVATGHGQFHAFDVSMVDRDHPITANLPRLRQHPDELYHRLIHMHEAPYRVLATAYSDPATGGTGQDEPMVIVQQYGKGRIFHTPLGHVWRGVEASRISHLDSQFRTLVVRGTEWAARGEVTDGVPAPNTLSSLERAAGWRLLFDGKSLEGWRTYGAEAAGEGWAVTDGCLHRVARGGDLISEGEFEDFELRFEWKLARGSNSGVKLRVNETPERPAAIGLEYQLLDDGSFPDLPRKQTSASIYDVLAPEAEAKALAHLGAFNESRILLRGGEVEHWLNGARVLEADMDSDAWKAAIATSKFAKVEGFGRGPGHIVLQDHGDEVFFRSIAIRPLAPREAAESMLPAEGLDSWREAGDAVYTVEEDAIRGKTGGGGQSFLISEATYGDFVLEVDVKLEDEGNSGIQIRSHQNDGGRVFGYQIEIDPSRRAWSGGLYDEARRGWLDDLTAEPAARAAFQRDGWNRYRIQAIGPWIRTWINGVPAADHLDPMDLEGFIALQVHSGNNTNLLWRDPRITDLGRRSWQPLEGAAFLLEGDTTLVDGQLGGSSGSAVLLDSVTDFSLQLDLVAGEGTRLHWRAAPGFDPDGARSEGSGLFVGQDGWCLEPLLLDGMPTGQSVRLTVSCYGPRVAIHADGKLLLDRSVHAASAAGQLSISAGAEGFLARDIQLLGPAR